MFHEINRMSLTLHLHLQLYREPTGVSVFIAIGQFYQHFTCSFCANILWTKNYEAKL